jgi:acyl-coenzyme A thioesterase PaaI-like protein
MADWQLSSPALRWMMSSEDISPRRAEMRRLADAGRLVIERMAATDAPHDAIERAAELLEAAAAELSGPGRQRTYEGFAESANAGGAPNAHFDHSPIMGMANPIAAPAQIESGGEDVIVMRMQFGSAYEGPPGAVHGGVVAGAFDELLGMTQSLSEQPGMTGTLTVRYRRPTPLHRELRFEGRLERVEGRKIFTSGRCFDGDVVTAEAEGLFIHVDFERIAAMAIARDDARPSEAGGASA